MLQEIMDANGDLGESLHLFADETIAGLAVQKSQPYSDSSRYTGIYPNGVAVMNLIGPIYPRANMMTMSGAVSIANFVQEFVAVHEDPAVKGIVMNIDSPGGDVRGIGDAAQIMHNLTKKGKKPVKSYGSGLMASAAYWIASTGQEIWGSEFSSLTGSIGVVMNGKAKGNGEYEIVSSQSPHKRPDPETKKGLNVIQTRVDDIAQMFIDNVALHRGISSEKVAEKYGQGDVMVASKAKTQGLIDKVGSLSDAIDAVAKEAQTGSIRKTRKVSTEAETLLSFDSEDLTDMGLRTLVAKFAPSTSIIDGAADDDKDTAQSNATDESDTASVEGQGQNEPAVEAPATEQALSPVSRETLEDQFSDRAELFATQMTVASRIFPAQQAHAVSDMLIACIDDKLVGGKVTFVNAEGQVMEGSREEAVRARYEAMPSHSLTKKAIAGVKDGSVVAKVLSEEDKKTDAESGPMSAERRAELLNASDAGQRVLAQVK